MEDDQEQELEVQKVNGGMLFRPGAFDLNKYAGEVADNTWTPDKTQPDFKIQIAVRIRALTGEDLNLVNQKFQEQRKVPTLINYQQQRLARCTPPYELDRKQKRLGEIANSDFTDDLDPEAEGYKTAEDKAEERRTELEGQIKRLNDEWQEEHTKIEVELDRLLNLSKLTAYELLRSEFFSRVIDDHNISWYGEQLDFTKPADPGKEPPDAFAGELYSHLLEVLRDEKKAKRRSGGSAR